MIERSTPARAALLALALAGAPGCAKWFAEEPPPPPPPVETVVPRDPTGPVYGCAGRRAQASADAPAVTLAQLRATVDTDVESAPTRALLGQLGQARRSADGASPQISHLEYDRLSLIVEQRQSGAAARVISVEMLGRKYGGMYTGPLPEGLSFEMSVEDTFRALGQPDEKALLTRAWERHHYRGRGLAVRFDEEGCLAAVAFVLPIPPRTVRFDDVTVAPQKARSGLDGIAVELTRSFGELPGPSTAMRISVELTDERGKPVRELGADGAAGSPFNAQIADMPRGEIRRALHIPFSSLALSPGRHALRGTLRAQATIEGAAVDLAAAAGESFPVAIDMPRLVRARIGVRSVEVEPGTYDAGALASSYSNPDLAWTLTRETERAGVSYLTTFTSKTRQDTLTGKWTELSSPFIAAPQDQIVLCIIDQDITVADEIGCFGMTFERYQADVKARTPLAKGKVLRLELATPKLQPIR